MSTSTSGANSPDRLYGQKALAEFCEHVVSRMFSPIEAGTRPGIDTPPLTPETFPRSSATKAAPPLVEFIAYALYRTRLPPIITHQALYLLKRLKARYPSARGTASSPHRLFLSSLMLSSKISMDDTYSNKSWAIVGGNFFPLREVNQMERELFAFLDFSLVVDNDELVSYIQELEIEWLAHARTSSPTAPTSVDGSNERKRRRSESIHSQESIKEVEALRHKRASDAAIALLRPTVTQAARYRASQRPRKPQFCDLRFSCSSSASSSPSTPEYRSTSSSAFSSASTSPATPASDLSPDSYGPEIKDTCDRFETVFSARKEVPQKDRSLLQSASSLENSVHEIRPPINLSSA